MLDIKFIRENKELIDAGAKKKHIDFDVKKLLEVDEERRKLIGSIEKKKAEQNANNDKIATAEPNEKISLIASMSTIKKELKAEEEKLGNAMKQWQLLMLQVPNIPDMTVPEGESDAQNVELRTVGTQPTFSFEPKNHIELMEALGMVDFERGSKVSGFRGYFLKNDGALLSFALWQFALDFWRKIDGFEHMIAPSLVRKETLLGTGYIPQGEDDLYKTQDGEYLAGTGEVASMSYFSDEVIEKGSLPKKMLVFSPCFRREAGSHGKDTKGIYRVHEFFKFEQIVLCEASHAQSVEHHEALTLNSEKMLQALGIPYRVVLNCGGDLGLGQVKKYDIECWTPSQKKYGETHSSSYFHDFQTRRLNIRYKDDDQKLKFAHSLNNTAMATPRLLISLIENNQNADGSINIPPVLEQYMGKKVIKL